MKVVEGINGVTVTSEARDGQAMQLSLNQGGEHAFLSMAVLLKPHQAYRLAAQINQIAQALESQDRPDGERQ